MRTNIVIDDDLIRAVLEATGLKTKRAVVEAGLRLLVKSGRQVTASQVLRNIVDWQSGRRETRKDG